MSNTIFITANWTTGALSQQTISRQYDNNRYAVQFVGYPEGDGTEELDLYLLVWMSTAPGQKPGEITPIQLNSDQWYISNYFTQQVQVIKFQLCVLNEAGTYEAHSPIFSGRIGDSLEHNGTSHDIDVSTLFDAYREYLNELIIGAGAVIIDPTPTQGSTNAVSSGGVYSVTADLDARVEDLEQSGTGGMSMTAVNLLNTILTEAVYGSDQTANIALLKKELSNIPPVSISAVLDGTALAGQAYSELSFIVTATFDDESTQVVDNYTIVTTGTVTAGSNTVTIRYRGITTTCTFTAEQVTTYSITYNLTNVASSSDVSVVRENAYYNTVLSVEDGYAFGSCTVTMGGVDITSTAFSNMEILITEVTGNVVITANATEITYMDDLIISRREFSGDLYSDNLVTKVGRMGGGVGVVAVSEYPALRDCEVTYTVTNNSGASVNLENQLGFGMIPSDNISNIHSGNKLINIPYWTKVSNSSGVLGDGESLTGTINLKAGYQLAMTAPKIAVYSALTVQLVGGYVADEFSGYEQITFSGASSNYGTYRAISFYSDNGTTLIKTQSSSTFKLISDSISAGTYDVYMAVRGAYDATNIGNNIVYVGAVADATSTQSNYAFGLTAYADPNMWYHKQITVTDDGMAVIGYGSYLSTGTIVDMRMKEVSA